MSILKGTRLLIVLALAGLFAAKIPFAASAGPNILFQSTDGVTLSAHRFGSGSNWVILAHMFPADQTSWFSFADSLGASGWTALTFDFRGYGSSAGERDISRIDRDLAGAVHYARRSGARRIVIIGASMGGTAALKVSASEPVDGVVALSPPVAFLGLTSEEALPSVRAPKFFLVSKDEMNVSVESVRRQYKAAPEPKRMEVVPGAAHGSRMLEGKAGKSIQGEIIGFVRSIFAPRTDAQRGR